MGQKITFTDDVGFISTAENVSGSIRWHCYDRLVAGKWSVYVRREVGGSLLAEVKLLDEGQKPEIFFDVGSLQWVLLYRLHEKFWMLRYLESEVPIVQSPQTDTLIDQFQTGLTDNGELESIAGRQSVLVFTAPSVDAYNGPPPPLAVGVGASPTPGFFRVRWRARLSTTTDGNAQFDYDPERHYIVGFHVYRRRGDSGALERLTGSLVPFVGLDPVIYELEVPAVAGTYYVTQVNHQGPRSTNLIEGRVHAPSDQVRSNGTAIPDLVRSFMDQKIGEGTQGPDLRFVVVSFAPINIIPAGDTFPSHLGEGFQGRTNVDFDYDVINIEVISDTFPSHLGEGFVSRLSQTGFDTVVVG